MTYRTAATVAPPHGARAGLLVTGQRVLDPRHMGGGGTPESEAWARGVLRDALAALPPGSFVLAGRCRHGPDAWTREIALAAGVRLVEYDADGSRWVDGFLVGEWHHRWAPRFAMLDPRTAPLVRNRAMVAALAAADAFAPSVLALVAPWREFGGTHSTIGHARSARLPVRVETYPGEAGKGALDTRARRASQ